jgi:electron transfer flavoprotein alpha subunit
MATLLLADHDNTALSPQTAHALTAALQLGGPVDILVAGDRCASVADEAARLVGVRQIRGVDDPVYEHHLAEPMAGLIVSLMAEYDALAASATSTGKNILPRVAALLNVMQVSDIIAVEAPDTFRRLIYAGNAIETVQSTDPKTVITVRTTSFDAAPEGDRAAIVGVTASPGAALSKHLSTARVVNDRPELSSARVVVSGGRAFGSKENFDALLGPLAAKLNAAIGASRAAVDAGYAGNDMQVGQTGKVVAPELYIACGISGAIQHLAGMKDSKVIVAINSDPSAPIFQIADYGLVGEVADLLPKLTELL